MRFIHAADIHLDSPLRGLERYEGAPVDEIRGATRRAFDNLVDLVIEEGVELVLLVGDLYDGDWRDYNTGLYLTSRLQRLREAGARVFIVSGNHDAASQITRHLRLPDNVTVFATRRPERVVLEDLGVAIAGQGFATRAVTEDLARAYPQADPQLFNIALLHTALDGKPGHEPYAPCRVEDLLAKGYQYWALGHVHRREVVHRDPWVVFPGNPQGRHIRETGPKGCTLVRVEGGEVVEVAARELDVLRWALCPVDLAGIDSPDEVYDRAQAALREALDAAGGRPLAARLALRGATRAHRRLSAEAEYWTQELRALATGLGGAGVWLERLVLETRPLGAATQADEALEGLLEAIMGIAPEEADVSALLRDDLEALLRRLPAPLHGGEEALDLDAPGRQRALFKEARDLLLARLLEG